MIHTPPGSGILADLGPTTTTFGVKIHDNVSPNNMSNMIHFSEYVVVVK